MAIFGDFFVFAAIFGMAAMTLGIGPHF